MLRSLKLATLGLAASTGATSWLLNSEWRRRQLLILCYHGISIDDEHLWSPDLYIPSSLFRQRMATLAGHCTVLGLGEALERLHAGTLPRRSVAVTFDDGTHDFYSLAYPILREFRIPATVYATTYYSGFQRPVFDVMASYLLWKARGRTLDWAEVTGPAIPLDEQGRVKVWKMLQEHARIASMSGESKDALLTRLASKLDLDYQDLRARRILHIMTPEEISELAKAGVDIQLHTHRHRTPLEQNRFMEEIAANRRFLEPLTGSAAKHFCYPSGEYRPEMLPWLRESGVLSATTCDTGLCRRAGDHLLLPRLLDVAGMSALEFEAWLSGLGALLPERKSPSMKSLLRRHWTFVLVFVLLGAIAFGTVRDGHDWGGDFSVYIWEARNIVEHQALDRSSYIPTADSLRFQPTVYPPLTSLILAPAYAIAGLNFRVLKYVLVVFLWCSLPFYYALVCRRGLRPIESAALILVFGLAPDFLSLKDSVLSDQVFLFFAGAALLWIDVVYEKGWDSKYPVAAAISTAALLLLCYLTRASGLSVIGAFAILEIWQARRARTFGVAVLTLLAAAMLAYTAAVYNAGQHYGIPLSANLRLYGESALYYLRTPAAVWAGVPPAMRYGLAAAVLILLPIGFKRQMIRLTIIEPYVILSIAVLVLYETETRRYIVPVMPFLLMYAVLGLRYLASRLGTLQREKSMVAGFGLAAILGAAFNLRLIESGPIQEGIAQPSFIEVCSFLKEQTPANGLILSWNPRVFALYTDKPSSLYPQSADAKVFEAGIPKHGAVFLVYHDSDLDRGKLTPYLESRGAQAPAIFQNRDFRVYSLPDLP